MSKEKTPLPMAQITRAARLFATLADPSRLRILQSLLSTGPRTVGELVEATGLGQANVSKHLSILHNARLVERRREGVFVRYLSSDPVIAQLCSIVCAKIERDVRQDLASLGGESSPPMD